MSEELGVQPIEHASLTVEANGHVVLGGSLGYLALRARATGDEVLTFLYRDAFNPEEPDEVRPVRRARIVIEELGVLKQGEQS